MNLPQWAWERAQSFWADAGTGGSLREAIRRYSFCLCVVDLPELHVASVRHYLQQRGLPWPAPADDRALHACLVTAREAGWIFVDAHDPPDEQNFSLAHELAHFLRHELQRRQRLQAALGPQADALLQGSRKANSDERLAGVLRQVEWQAYTHLLQREGGHLTPGVQKAEQEADLLAVELLAPEAVFWSHGPTDAPSAQRIYREIFGLPEAIAVAQAERLFPAPATGAISQRMRNFLVKRRTSEA